MKSLYYLVHYNDDMWGMRFRFLFKRDKGQTEDAYLMSAMNIVFSRKKAKNPNLDWRAFCNKIFSLRNNGVVIPDSIDEIALTHLEPLDWMIAGNDVYSDDKILDISALELCKRVLFATSHDHDRLLTLAKSLNHCVVNICDFVCSNYQEHYFEKIPADRLSDREACTVTPREFFIPYYPFENLE